MKINAPFYLRIFPFAASTAVALTLLTSVCSEGQRPDTAKAPSNGSSGIGSAIARNVAAGPDTPVARVNGVTIYQSDLSCAIEVWQVKKTDLKPGSADSNRQAANVGDDTLKRLVNIELLYQESLKHRFHGLIEESDRRYQAEVKRIGGEQKLASALQCNNMSPEQFRKSIFRNLSIKRLLDKLVYSTIKVTDDEISEYYEMHKERFRKPRSIRISQILVKAPSDPGDEKWQQAETRAIRIYQDLKKGADFVRLAQRFSEDPVSASAGGDIGSIQIGSKQGVFDTTIFKLKEGSVTEPIRSHQGFHIVKVTSATPPSIKTLGEARQQIITQIRRERSRKLISRLINDLRDKAEIEIIKNGTRQPVPGTQ